MECGWERFSPCCVDFLYPLCVWFPLLGRSFLISCSHTCQLLGLFPVRLWFVPKALALPTHMFWIILPMFLFGSLSFSIKVFDPLQIDYLQDERYRSNFVILKVDGQFCQHHLLNKMSLFQCMVCDTFVKIKCVGLFLGRLFCSIGLLLWTHHLPHI